MKKKFCKNCKYFDLGNLKDDYYRKNDGYCNLMKIHLPKDVICIYHKFK